MKITLNNSFLNFRNIFFVICFIGCQFLHAQTFNHPCAMLSQSQLNRMQAMVADSMQPWTSGWHALLANSHCSTSYKMQGPVDTVFRGTGYPENYSKLFNDIAAAYALALHYQVSGDTASANCAVRILNAWGSTLRCIDGTSDRFLASGIYGYEIANAAELMRSYSGWSTTNFNTFKSMMKKVFAPMNDSFLVYHNGACISHYWANWDLCNIASMMAIGILCDSAAQFNTAINYFDTGAGNGSLNNVIYHVFPGPLGQIQEAGRDQGHSGLDLALLGPICEMGWNNGYDLYDTVYERIMGGSEYVAKYNLGNNVPYVTYNNCDNVNQTIISSASRVYIDTTFGLYLNTPGNRRDCWEILYNHYANRRGLPVPFTSQMADSVRPEGGGGHYDPNSGGYDELGYGTLTYSISPLKDTVKTPMADTYVDGGADSLTNYGTATTIVTKSSSTAIYNRIGYLRFALPSLPSNSLRVTGAKIRLYTSTLDAPCTRAVYAVPNDTWSQSTIDYSNKPADSALLTVDSISTTGWVEFDVSSYVINKYKSDNLISIAIMDTVTNNNIAADFNSTNNTSNFPQLVVIIDTLTTAPATKTDTATSPVADTYVQGGTDSLNNYGTATTIITKSSTSNPSVNRYGYVRYALPTLPSNFQKVTSAKLWFYTASLDAPCTRSIYAVPNDTWGETTINYHNQPADSALLTTDSVKAAGWVSFDLTNYVIEKYNSDQLLSVCIKDTVANNNLAVTFNSKENTSNHPYLVVFMDTLVNGHQTQSTTLKAELSVEQTPSFKMYPNPVRNTLSIKLDSPVTNDATVSVYSITGKMLQTKRIINTDFSLDLRQLANGSYFISINNGGQRTVKQFIKIQ